MGSPFLWNTPVIPADYIILWFPCRVTSEKKSLQLLKKYDGRLLDFATIIPFFEKLEIRKCLEYNVSTSQMIYIFVKWQQCFFVKYLSSKFWADESNSSSLKNCIWGIIFWQTLSSDGNPSRPPAPHSREKPGEFFFSGSRSHLDDAIFFFSAVQTRMG